MRNAFVACISAALLLLTIPTATQSPQELRVVLLGTGTPSPVMTRFGASILVDAGTEHFLFDAGRGALQRLRQIGINDVTRLFLTHLHSDHVVGIPDLYLTGWLFSNRQVPFSVRGPDGTSAMMNHLREAFAIDIGFRISDDKKPADGAKVDAKDITEGVAYEQMVSKSARSTLTTARLNRLSGIASTSAGTLSCYRATQGLVKTSLPTRVGQTFSFTKVAAIEGQTQATSSVLEHHTTPEQAGEVFSRVHPKLAVYSHIVGGFSDEQLVKITRKTYQGPISLGSDLMAFSVGDTIAVYEIK